MTPPRPSDAPRPEEQEMEPQGRGEEAGRIMAIDWIGFGYAALLVSGGFMGFSRKGSIVSLAAGLTFGVLAAYGALRVSNNPRDIKISLIAAGTLSVIMGLRYNRSRKVMPAGLLALISIFIVLKLLVNLS
ncbi:transmembrane protein 14A isoform X3 [Engystomops pustulosus]|uniref:transmembrane protein 14A isoform X3 n=1 Tax=Engystomops pustulosus TaxID=76066 RepID=UPI003AFA8E7A